VTFCQSTHWISAEVDVAMASRQQRTTANVQSQRRIIGRLLDQPISWQLGEQRLAPPSQREYVCNPVFG
jgi:hypothetical protein